MSKSEREFKRKFGVKRTTNLDLICKDCGKRAGEHFGHACTTQEFDKYSEDLENERTI